MPSARLVFSAYQPNNENGGGRQLWVNPQSAGAASPGAGAYSLRDPNSADMNWMQTTFSGSGGYVPIPAGSIITGIQFNAGIYQPSGNQTGGVYDVSLFKDGAIIATKSGSIVNGGSAGPFGSPTDLWGLVGLTPEYFASGISVGHHCNFPVITSDILVQTWECTMDVYYSDPTPQPTSINASGGSNQKEPISTQYPIQMYAQVLDQGGLGVAGVGVTWRMPAAGASATFDGGFGLTYSANTNSQGIATSAFFTANSIVGTWNPTCEVTANAALKSTYYQENLPAPVVKVPTNMLVVQGTGQSTVTNSLFTTQLKAKVLDQFGAAMPNQAVGWSVPAQVNPSGNFVGGSNTPSSLTDTNGVATAPGLAANSVAGSWQAKAESISQPTVFVTFNLTNIQDTSPSVPYEIITLSGGNQKAGLNSPYAQTLDVQVLDQYGAPFPNRTVTFTIPSLNNGVFQNGTVVTTAITDANGLCQSTIITAGGQAGSFTVNVTGTTVTALFTLTNVNASIITSMQAYGGNNQKTAPSTAFAKALSVRLLNGLGTGVPGGSVTFTAPGAGASCKINGAGSQVVISDSSGVATSAIPVANATVGTYNVVASHSGVTNVNFALTNGLNYLPEVCTVMETPPSGCVNTTIGGVGTPASWSNPQNAGKPAQGGSYASVVQELPQTDNSYYMMTQPQPADWYADIEDGAKINSIQVQGSLRGTGFTASPTLYTALIINGAVWSSGGTRRGASSAGAQNVWVNWGPILFTLTGGLTGAALKSATSGVGFNVAPPGNVSPGAQDHVNGLKMLVCYQNPDEPVTEVSVPLQFCEA